MTLTELTTQVAQTLGYWDFTNSQVLSGKDINSTMIVNAINHVYRERVFPVFAEKFPEYFVQDSYANTHDASSTVATISGTTLTSNTAIFSEGAVNGTIYNSTVEDAVVVSSYTSTTEVELATTPTGWSASDAIHLLTGIYTFGGDASDIYMYPRFVGVKFSSDDTDFTKVKLYNSSSLFKDKIGQEKDVEFTESNPVYIVTTKSVGTAPTSAIQIKPIPQENVTDGIYIEYVARPAALSSGSDVPRLPLGHHRALADGAAADLLFMVLNRAEKGQIFEAKFQAGLAALMQSIQSHDEEVVSNSIRDTISKLRRRDY